jgi:hypothetical protein
MTSKIRPLFLVAAASAALLCPSTADAFDIVKVGIGFIGQAGGNFLDKPSDQTVPGIATDSEYPGFAGLMTGVGGFIDLRFIDYVGVELDVFSATHKGTADLTVTPRNTTIPQKKYEIKISNSAIHMPLLIKGAIPGEIVTPMLFVGPEFVFPGKAKCAITPTSPVSGATTECALTSTSGDNSLGVVEELDSYTLVTFGLGMEFNLPLPVDILEVRIPFTLRGSIDPGSPDKRVERSQIEVTGGSYSEKFKTQWKFQALATLGVSVHF